jgi:hypothetical protein
MAQVDTRQMPGEYPRHIMEQERHFCGEVIRMRLGSTRGVVSAVFFVRVIKVV